MTSVSVQNADQRSILQMKDEYKKEKEIIRIKFGTTMKMLIPVILEAVKKGMEKDEYMMVCEKMWDECPKNKRE